MNKLREIKNNKLLQELRHIQEEIKDIDKKLDNDFEFPNYYGWMF